MENLDLGSYIIKAKSFKDYDLEGTENQTVILTAAESNQTVVFNYKAIVGTVIGRVTRDDGTPIVGVKIELHSEPRSVLTDNDGYYIFEDVELGEHTIYIRDDNYQEKAKNLKELKIIVKLDDNGTVEVKRVQDKKNAFTGLIIDQDNRTRQIDFIVIPKIPEEIKKLPKTGEQTDSVLIISIIIAAILAIVCAVDFIKRSRRKGLINK